MVSPPGLIAFGPPVLVVIVPHSCWSPSEVYKTFSSIDKWKNKKINDIYNVIKNSPRFCVARHDSCVVIYHTRFVMLYIIYLTIFSRMEKKNTYSSRSSLTRPWATLVLGYTSSMWLYGNVQPWEHSDCAMISSPSFQTLSLAITDADGWNWVIVVKKSHSVAIKAWTRCPVNGSLFTQRLWQVVATWSDADSKKYYNIWKQFCWFP